MLYLDELETPIGLLGVVLNEEHAAVAIDWMDHEGRMLALLERHGTTSIGRRDAGDIATRLRRYFAGEVEAVEPIPVALAGTPFQVRVWEALRSVRAGRTMSYGALAAALGRPGAARAVGLANSQNPVSIVLPCHRIIGANGALTGYAGGLDRKRWLLDHEAEHARLAPPSLFRGQLPAAV
jgi:methylated-DNA-[protein]-cysteine S-methyltransferase